MDCEKEISSRIEKIKITFQSSKELSTIQTDLNILIEQLEKNDPEFISVSFEGASMGIALTDFEKAGALRSWHLFNEKAKAHSAQTHVGLGWAIAQKNIAAAPILETMSFLPAFRVLDGCGYYDGIVRQRQSIKHQKIPDGIDGTLLHAYDHGIGRSLWYLSKGNVDKLHEMILGFSSNRCPDLWIGIGIACSYVGGCDEALLKSLQSVSGDYKKHLAIGAALAARSRSQANTLTYDLELACKILCNTSVKEAIQFTVEAEELINSANPKDAYASWLSQIGNNLTHVPAINTL